jgi:hypothetical protein
VIAITPSATSSTVRSCVRVCCPEAASVPEARTLGEASAAEEAVVVPISRA